MGYNGYYQPVNYQGTRTILADIHGNYHTKYTFEIVQYSSISHTDSASDFHSEGVTKRMSKFESSVDPSESCTMHDECKSNHSVSMTCFSECSLIH